MVLSQSQEGQNIVGGPRLFFEYCFDTQPSIWRPQKLTILRHGQSLCICRPVESVQTPQFGPDLFAIRRLHATQRLMGVAEPGRRVSSQGAGEQLITIVCVAAKAPLMACIRPGGMGAAQHMHKLLG